jgi:hypothetical protein
LDQAFWQTKVGKVHRLSQLFQSVEGLLDMDKPTTDLGWTAPAQPLVKNGQSLQGKLAQLLPVDMQSHGHYWVALEASLDAQSPNIKSKTWVKPEFPVHQLAVVEQVFLVVCWALLGQLAPRSKLWQCDW